MHRVWEVHALKLDAGRDTQQYVNYEGPHRQGGIDGSGIIPRYITAKTSNINSIVYTVVTPPQSARG